jgi:hypothetical protein
MSTPSFACARFKPSSWDWLKERSLNFPMSLMTAALIVAPALAGEPALP